MSSRDLSSGRARGGEERVGALGSPLVRMLDPVGPAAASPRPRLTSIPSLSRHSTQGPGEDADLRAQAGGAPPLMACPRAEPRAGPWLSAWLCSHAMSLAHHDLGQHQPASFLDPAFPFRTVAFRATWERARVHPWRCTLLSPEAERLVAGGVRSNHWAWVWRARLGTPPFPGPLGRSRCSSLAVFPSPGCHIHFCQLSGSSRLCMSPCV